MSMFSEEIMEQIAAAESAGRAAGLFWRYALEDPKFDNGDDSERGFMTAMLANMIPRPQVSEDQWQIFIDHIANVIDSSDGYHRYLSVDYDPDFDLGEAAYAADIELDSKAWPWKTSTQVTTAGEVEASFGYHAPWVIIWKPEARG